MVSLISSLFSHRGSEALVREQVSFFIRDAQNTLTDIGKIIDQMAGSGHPDIAGQCTRLAQLNARAVKTLEQAQKSVN